MDDEEKQPLRKSDHRLFRQSALSLVVILFLGAFAYAVYSLQKPGNSPSRILGTEAVGTPTPTPLPTYIPLPTLPGTKPSPTPSETPTPTPAPSPAPTLAPSIP